MLPINTYALSTINTSNYEYQIIESSDHLEMTNEWPSCYLTPALMISKWQNNTWNQKKCIHCYGRKKSPNESARKCIEFSNLWDTEVVSEGEIKCLRKILKMQKVSWLNLSIWAHFISGLHQDDIFTRCTRHIVWPTQGALKQSGSRGRGNSVQNFVVESHSEY